jgi:hypothetical protein
MSETKPKIENLEQPAQELTPEQAEAAAGGKKAVSELKIAQAQIEAQLAELQSAQQDLASSPPPK